MEIMSDKRFVPLVGELLVELKHYFDNPTIEAMTVEASVTETSQQNNPLWNPICLAHLRDRKPLNKAY